MQRWTQRHQLRLITELSITPLLALVLVLLLVFMVTGPLIQEGAALRPSSTASKPGATSPKTIATLKLGTDKMITLDGHAVPVADLQNQLASLIKDQPDTGVLVQIDRDLPVQVLVDLMETLRQAGVQKTSVATLTK